MMNRMQKYPSESIYKNIPGISPGTIRIVSDKFHIASVTDFSPDGDRTGKSIPWANISKAVLLRDNYTCRICDRSSFTTVTSATDFDQVHLDVQVHHIIPRKDGGKDTFKNLITLCEECHHKTFKGGYSGIPVEKQQNLFSFEEEIIVSIPQDFTPSIDHRMGQGYIPDYTKVHNDLRERWEIIYLQGSKLPLTVMHIKRSTYHKLIDQLSLLTHIADYVTMYMILNGRKEKVRIFIDENGQPLI